MLIGTVNLLEHKIGDLNTINSSSIDFFFFILFEKQKDRETNSINCFIS